MEPEDVRPTFRTSREAFGQPFPAEQPSHDRGWFLGIFIFVVAAVAAWLWFRS